MPSPVLPSDIKNILPAANSSLCGKILAWFRGLELLYKLVSYMFNDDGTVSTAFKGDIGIAVGALTAPTGVAASDGTYEDHVVITWGLVAGATYYEIYRATTDDSTTAVSLGTSTTSSFTDSTAVADTRYFYFVKAKTASDSSGFSASDIGYSDTTGGGGVGTTGSQIFTGNGSWVVPAGVTKVEVEMWGGGGGGGGSGAAFCDASANNYGGGGGGSGEYRKTKQITVTPAETLTIIVGYAGAAGHGVGGGHSSAGGGSAGGPSILRRSATDLVSALGGAGGGNGACYDNGPGGAGGTGGATSSGTEEAATNGSAGGNATSANPVGTGGAGGAANHGYAAGGAGGALSAGVAGGAGKVILTWPGTA